MNIKYLGTIVTIAFLTGGCGKSQMPPTTSQAPPPIQAEAFHGQVYKSLKGGTVLTLISKDECELSEHGTILLCKYTKQNDKLRVVTTALGTSQVLYYRFTNQGLQDNDGKVLFSPERYLEIQRNQMVKDCRKNFMRLVAAEEQWAVENRKNSSDTPTRSDLAGFLKDGFLKCPKGGVYTLNAVDSSPTCSIAGHRLP